LAFLIFPEVSAERIIMRGKNGKIVNGRYLMEKLIVGDPAPDFELPNHKSDLVRLSEMTRDKNVMLVFNIGFA
jgi:hypothetical protein